MVDAFVLEANISAYSLAYVIERHKLEEGVKYGCIYYKSGRNSGIRGSLEITIEEGENGDGKAKVKGSLHKFYNWSNGSGADNTTLFTLSQMVEAWEMLETFLGFPILESGKIKSYEFGVNLHVSKDPKRYIDLAISVDRAREPQLYEDPYYNKLCQKVTRKQKYLRTYYKIYDKGAQAKATKRKEIGNVLRIETVRRRADITPRELIESRDKITRKFLEDWRSLQFQRVNKAFGVVGNGAWRLEAIATIGAEEFLRREEESYKAGYITPEQRKTSRRIVRDYEHKHKDKVKQVVSEEEEEYYTTLDYMEAYYIMPYRSGRK